jgi:DNA-binding IclR family transcriptional regulator
LGIELIGLASQVVSYLDVREVARPFLQRLAKDCQESVNLVVLEDGQVINLEQFVPAARQVKNIGRVGRRMYAHCTAAGKIMLANLSPAKLDDALDSKLVRFTANTITQPDELRLQLAQIRKRGYAAAQEELEDGLNAIAAPIHDHTGQVVAAISIAGPAYRIPPEAFSQLARQLAEVTDQVSRKLGYDPTR